MLADVGIIRQTSFPAGWSCTANSTWGSTPMTSSAILSSASCASSASSASQGSSGSTSQSTSATDGAGCGPALELTGQRAPAQAARRALALPQGPNGQGPGALGASRTRRCPALLAFAGKAINHPSPLLGLQAPRAVGETPPTSLLPLQGGGR
eukprot:CAMPEP_0180766448 /NCGR_PEP_ID=MMETSP1038_2-20121128/39494_1 /TAXON_ID=632150 /ORGANISM="Azadinium spinosum, Strain 3D9" /LENGTH=152 /DNA_ID=CAMNT_0022800947 /DNA_START=145 /DNA_END=599 /DNA_ORIENTATION=-